MIAGQPQIDVGRPNFRDLSESAGWPVRLYPMNDEQLSLDRFWWIVAE